MEKKTLPYIYPMDYFSPVVTSIIQEKLPRFGSNGAENEDGDFSRFC